MKKIDLMIIGAQKAGTTSLKNYLGQHPQIASHFQTEFSYFTDPQEFELGYDAAFVKYISKTDAPPEVKIVAKNSALYFSEKELKLFHDHNPLATVVLLLREPLERAYSAYNMEHTYNTQWMKNDFEGILKSIAKKDFEDPMYKLFIKMGLYSECLEMIYKYFPKNQVKIILFEEMELNPLKVCQDLFITLGVDPHFTPDVSVIHNKTAKSRSLLVAKILDRLRNNDNKIKKFAKQVLPHKTFFKLSFHLMEFNKSKRKKIEPLNPAISAKFKDYFRPFNKRLEELSGDEIISIAKQILK